MKKSNSCSNDEIAQICNSRAKDVYGEELPKAVQERLETEINSILKNGFAAIYMIAHKLVKKSNEDGYLVGFRGNVGASLVAYLLGITEIDPLVYHIPFESFAGLDGDNIPDIDLNFSKDYQSEICKYVEETLQYPRNNKEQSTFIIRFDISATDGTPISIDLLSHDDPTIIRRMEALTGVNAKTIPLDDKKTLSVLRKADTLGVSEFGTDFVRNMIKGAKPKDFDDFVKIFGLAFGTDVWESNADELISSGVAAISEVIALKDEIMAYLTDKNLDRETAYNIMANVWKGEGLTPKQEDIMTKAGIPGWYIESCNKILYIFPKAQAVAYTMMAFRIAWFKVHYPKAFYETYFEVKCDSSDMDFYL